MRIRRIGKTSLLIGSALALLLVLAVGTNASPLREGWLVRPGPHNTVESAQDTPWISGWLDIAPDQTLSLDHNLGGNPVDYAVDLWFRDTDPDGLGINHRAFGGIEVNGHFAGAAWQRLTASSIEVHRAADDPFADQVLLRVWVPPDPPVWDSGWRDIAPATMITLTHNVGGDPDQYTVSTKFRDTDAQGVGVNLRLAGGLDVEGATRGAAWESLTDTTIQVVRFPADTVADQVRIQIYQPEPPTWDSGWQEVTPGESLELTHNLGGNPLGYVVRSFAKDTRPDGRGINARYAGGIEFQGLFFGSNWEKLTSQSISVFRQPNDGMAHTADQVRVRIWRPEYRVYLPVVTRAVSAASQ